MRMRWKLLGVAGLAGVAAGGVAIARNRRPQSAYGPAELRERLHRRLADVDERDGGQRTPTRSTTNTSVSSGPMTPPAPRLP
jgi:hypothetical protein